jgi:hypothetical protein
MEIGRLSAQIDNDCVEKKVGGGDDNCYHTKQDHSSEVKRYLSLFTRNNGA